MNINIMLLSFVIIGLVTFQNIFYTEMAQAQDAPAPLQSSVISNILTLFKTPVIDTTVLGTCEGFTDCAEAFFSIVIDVVVAIIIILYDVVLAISLFIAILVFPIPDAPIIINVIFYALKIGGIVALIAIIKPGGNG